MSGPNQHHIPQFLQRGFGVKRKGKPKTIWFYSKDGIVEERPIDITASEEYFYSVPSPDGAPTLDDVITKYESERLGFLMAKLKEATTGIIILPEEAAEIISHLAPRSSHFRDVMRIGFEVLINTSAKIFSEPNLAMNLLGIDGSKPKEFFKSALADRISEIEAISALSIPQDTIERMAFIHVKENFEDIFSTFTATAVEAIDKLQDGAGEMIRETHNETLRESICLPNRRSVLEQFYWTVETSNTHDLILPDCVAIALDYQNRPSAFITSGSSQSEMVMFPISSRRVLVGRRDPNRKIELDQFNNQASSCAEQFFLASSYSEQLNELTSRIGKSTHALLNKAMSDVIISVTERVDSSKIEQSHVEANVVEKTRIPYTQSSHSFQITFDGDVSPDNVNNIANKISLIVGGVGQALPLNRLDGITFSANYVAALGALDRGFEGALHLSSINEEIGIGVAQSPLIIRDGQIKSRILARSEIAWSLISDNPTQIASATHVLVAQLAEVALAEFIDTKFPGVLLRPFERAIDSFLYPSVNPALYSYFSARASAGFDSANESLSCNQQLLAASLDRMMQKIPSARIAYRYDGNLDALLAVARECIQHTLMFCANVIGHADGADIDPFHRSRELETTLKEAGLFNWFKMFSADLRVFWERRGQWASFAELLSFNKHVERLCWQFGLIPWETCDGNIWIEVPLGTDAEALMKATSSQPLPCSDL